VTTGGIHANPRLLSLSLLYPPQPITSSAAPHDCCSSRTGVRPTFAPHRWAPRPSSFHVMIPRIIRKPKQCHSQVPTYNNIPSSLLKFYICAVLKSWRSKNTINSAAQPCRERRRSPEAVAAVGSGWEQRRYDAAGGEARRMKRDGRSNLSHWIGHRTADTPRRKNEMLYAR
jgi:hypothetical protein